jgi:integrase
MPDEPLGDNVTGSSAEAGAGVRIGPQAGLLRRSNFRETWYRARGAVGQPELHFHDLRHTGNTMAAAQGASLRELMERMGHSSARAALIYLHATRERDQKAGSMLMMYFFVD